MRPGTPPGPRIIGLFYIISGSYGLLFIALHEAILADFIGAIAGAFLFGYTVRSGYWLLKDDPRGTRNGMRVAALQVVNFTIAGINYAFRSGMFLGFAISPFAAGFALNFHTTCWVYFSHNSDFYQVSVNFFALALYFYLRRMKNEKKKEESLDSLAESFKRTTSAPKKETVIETKITPKKENGPGRGERPH